LHKSAKNRQQKQPLFSPKVTLYDAGDFDRKVYNTKPVYYNKTMTNCKNGAAKNAVSAVTAHRTQCGTFFTRREKITV
jgi:hypothetical protein